MLQGQSIDAPAAPVTPRCEYAVNPLGLGEPRPRFSWLVNDLRRGAAQSAYRVLVAASASSLEWERGDVWDSGQIASDQSAHIVYDGPALASGQRYHWTVRTWDAHGVASPWSPPAWFEMGLLSPGDWSAQWIGFPPGNAAEERPCPHFRRDFTLRGPVRQARLHLTARGVCEWSINGQRVGQDHFAPGWTDYRQRLPVRTYDVTPLLQQGDNALGAILADGWYSGHVGWKHRFYGDRPWLLGQLVIEYVDGHVEHVVTNCDWKATLEGPIRASDMQMGEVHDSARELPGWNQPGFDARAWSPVDVQPRDATPLTPALTPPVREIETLQPLKCWRQSPGVHVLDMGQNMVGWVRLNINAPAGTRLTLRHAEVLNPDQTLYIENLRGAKATDVLLARGGQQTWQPRFTFHGFRYVEVTTDPAIPIDIPSVTGVVLHSDTPPTGAFECSHPLVNQLQHNIIWGQKGNFLEVPTDCPQRNERLGWTGDIQVFIGTACFNMDVAAFMSKWLTDLFDAQGPLGELPSVAPNVLPDFKPDGGPGWADAGVIVPWTLYQCYGDRRILERHFPAILRYVDYLDTVDAFARHNYADWLHHDAFTPPDLLHAAFSAHSIDLAGRMAKVLGRTKDAAKLAARFKRHRTAFQKRYLTPEGRLVGDTQTAYALALRFGLLPDALRAAAATHLARDIDHGRFGNTFAFRKGHLSTGFLGVKHLTFALDETGHLDLAYRLLLAEDYPSWLFPVKNGATTIWERWDGWTPDKGFQNPGMNSFNHYAYGAIGQWLYESVLGLRTDTQHPGYQRFHVAPRILPDLAITSARGHLDTMHGRIEVAWSIDQSQTALTLTVPANTQAQLRLPCTHADHLLEHGQPASQAQGVSSLEVRDGAATCLLQAGTYAFTSR